MSTTTNNTVLEQDTTPSTTASPAPSTNAAGSTPATIRLSSQYAAVDATLGYMTGLSDMMNHLQELLNDRLVNQWDYIDKNYNDMKNMAEDQFKASMSSAAGTIGGGLAIVGTTGANWWRSRGLHNTLETQQAEKAQLEELDRFLKGGPAVDVELPGGD